MIIAAMIMTILLTTGLTAPYSYMYADPDTVHSAPVAASSFLSPRGVGVHSSQTNVLLSGTSNRYAYLKLIGMNAVFVEATTCVFDTSSTFMPSWTVLHIPGTNFFIFSREAANIPSAKVDISSESAPIITDAAFPQVFGSKVTSMRLVDPAMNLMIAGEILTLFDMTTTPMTAVSVIASFSYSATKVAILSSNTAFAFIESTSFKPAIYRIDVGPAGLTLGTKSTSVFISIPSAFFTVPSANLLVVCEANVCSAIENTADLTLKMSFKIANPVVTGWSTASMIFSITDDSSNILVFDGSDTSGSPIYTFSLASSAEQIRFTYNDEFMIVTRTNQIEYLRNRLCSKSNCARCHFKDICLECQAPFFLAAGNCDLICDLTCANCTGPNPTECISCSPGRSLVSGTCIECHKSCLACTGTTETECQSCAPGSYLLKVTGGQYCKACHISCSECSGPTNQDCTSCQKSKGFEMINGACELPKNSPVANCEPKSGLIDYESQTCIKCILEKNFHTHKACKNRTDIVYLEFDITLRPVSSPSIEPLSEFIIEVTLIDPSNILAGIHNLDILKQRGSGRSRFDLKITPRLNPKVLKSNDSAVWFRVSDLADEQFLTANLTTADNVDLNTVFLNDSCRIILIAKETVLKLDLEEEILRLTDQGWLINGGIDVYIKTSIGFTLPALFIGNLAGLDFNTAFIKMFQLIEIIGKLYFAPALYSIHMHRLLHFIRNLSEFLSLNLEALLKPPFIFTTRYYGKLTKNKVGKRMFKEGSVSVLIVILVILIFAADRLLNVWKPNLRKKLVPFRNLTTMYLLELNIVDSLFFSCYTLTSDYDTSSNPQLLKFLMNKLLAAVVFSFYISFACIKFLRVLNCNSQNSLDLLAKRYSLKVEACSDFKVRSLVPLYYWRIIMLITLIVMCQFSYLWYICMFSALNMLSQFYYCFVVFVHRPYRSIMAMIEGMAPEIVIFVFNWMIIVSSTGHHPWILRQAFVLLVCLTLVTQTVSAVFEFLPKLIQILKKRCQKKEVQVSNLQQCLPKKLKRAKSKVGSLSFLRNATFKTSKTNLTSRINSLRGKPAVADKFKLDQKRKEPNSVTRIPEDSDLNIPMSSDRSERLLLPKNRRPMITLKRGRLGSHPTFSLRAKKTFSSNLIPSPTLPANSK